MAERRKGVSDVKTMTGMASQGAKSKLYFRLGAASLERERRLRERDAGFSRIDDVQKKLNQVNETINRIKEDIGDEPAPVKRPSSVAKGQRSSANSASAARGAKQSGLKIKY